MKYSSIEKFFLDTVAFDVRNLGLSLNIGVKILKATVLRKRSTDAITKQIRKRL